MNTANSAEGILKGASILLLFFALAIAVGASVNCIGSTAYADELASGAVSDDSGGEAEEPKTYKGGFLYNTKIEQITVKGKPIYCKNDPDSVKSVGGVTFNEKSKTLTVKNVNAKSNNDYIYIDGSEQITVNLVGKNTFKNTNSRWQAYFIHNDSSKGTLTVNNSGTLTLNNAGGIQSYSNINVKSGTYKANKLDSSCLFCAIDKKLTISSKCKIYFTQKDKKREIYPFQAKTVSNSWKSLKTYHYPRFVYPDGTEYKYYGCIFKTKIKNGVSGVILKKAGVASNAEYKKIYPHLQPGVQRSSDSKAIFSASDFFTSHYDGNVKFYKVYGFAKNAFKGVNSKFNSMHQNVGRDGNFPHPLPCLSLRCDKQSELQDYCLRGLKTISFHETTWDFDNGVNYSLLSYSNGKYTFGKNKVSKKAFAGISKNATLHIYVRHWNKSINGAAADVIKLLKKHGLPSGVKIEFGIFADNFSERITTRS